MKTASKDEIAPERNGSVHFIATGEGFAIGLVAIVAEQLVL